MNLAAAMVLAAGRGERMRPLSDCLPKPALPLIHQPLIASALRLAAATGTPRIAVNTWHLADAMEDALAELELGVEVNASRESELMNTAGGIALARDRGLLGDDGPVLIVNGDGLLNLDLSPLLKRMADSDDLVSLALLPHLDPHRWSRVILDYTGRVSRFEKPGTPKPGEVPLLYPGVMLVAREALDELAPRPGAVPDDLWRPALAKGRLSGVLVSGHWREVGTPSDYLDAVLGLLNGGGAVVHPSAHVDSSAAIGSAMIGRGARIECGAVVGEAVIAEGARVAENSRVVRSVLLGGVATRAGEVVTDEYRAAPQHTSAPR
jgi:NDP-sugar pyrophosphorylase family protein